ncbi:hypothetical protein GJ699_24685 [Duganella sp. FT80W]|uniref:Histidine kinase/HSP90-like ATPase domain-containing protein n=1 Tax=Duganella guangzhouensis TaxID=2666084 RepID=A0A6I2L8L8_9BURK|nr:triple tyrosine motif-containing protein [Duganella guangzhouensis]MRW93194.1 hypothetical protein [Duganella guangzhouensis]
MKNIRSILRGRCRTLCLPAFILIQVLITANAWALDPLVNLQDYRHDTWRKKDGAPGNLSSMVQTRDGWLWLGNSNGLYRFDGLTFERFVSPAGRRLRGLRISTMYAAENGDLYVAYYEGGFDLIRNGELQVLPNADKAPPEIVFALAPDIDNSVWVATTKGLMRYADNGWQRSADGWGLPAKMTEVIVLDNAELWALVTGTWYRFDRTSKRFRATDRPAETDFFYAPNGDLWQVAGDDVVRLPKAQRGVLRPGFAAHSNANASGKAMFDRDGNLWLLASPNGIARIRKQDIPSSDKFTPSKLPAQRLDQAWQLSSLTTDSMLEDREGNIWVATSTGLEKFSHQNIRTMPLPADASLAVPVADWAGDIWISAGNMERPWNVSAGARPPPIVNMAHSVAVRGHGGAFVTNTPTAIERRYADHTEVLPMPSCGTSSKVSANILVEDKTSTWVTAMPCGTYRYVDGKWHNASEYEMPPTTRNYAAAADGAVWFITQQGTAWRFQNERMQQLATADVGAARFIDVQKDVLVSGSSGTAVLKGSRFERLRAQDPDALRYLAGIMITANGDRWLHGLAGLMLAKSADWEASVRDPQIPLRLETFGARDGYPGDATLSLAANGAIDSKGKLWFVGTEGIGVLDPNQLYRNTVAPVVQITSFKADGRPLQLGNQLHLGDAASKVEIHFAALSLTAPEQMKILYRLEGNESEWQDAGRMRQASYTNLAPGSYRFHVKAANADGVWSEQDAVVRFDLAPRFTQTIWFYLLCAAGVLALGYLLYVLRMRQVVGRLNALLGARLMERERIARALHDSWLQEVHGLVLNFSNVSNTLPAESTSRQRMEELLLRADGVLINGRSAVMGLRAAAVRSSDMERAFDSLGERLQHEHGPLFSLRLRGAVRLLDNTAWEEIYFIGYEALQNAYRHAQAQRVTMTLDYGVEKFTLMVRDDGGGMPPQVLHDGALEGHFGLVGMRERAEIVGGIIELRSPNARGTEVCFSIPSEQAYAVGTQAGWLARLRASLRGLLRRGR